jgi:chaperonin GroES
MLSTWSIAFVTASPPPTRPLVVACGNFALLAYSPHQEESMTTTATKPKARQKVSLQPLDDRVLILPKEPEQAMRGGLHIPDSAREKPTQGEVLAVGPGRFERGVRVQMDLRAGDTVVYGQYSGTPYQVAGDELVIVKASDILAKIG